MKTAFPTIRRKNQVIERILEAVRAKNHFLLLGHQNPDEDCIASLVAFALLVTKFTKDARIYLGKKPHEHFQYLLQICRFNSIPVLYSYDETEEPPEAIVICDTPKPAMIEKNQAIDSLLERESMLVIEIDHHLGADSAYCGREGYCLVTEASSASELVGHILLKLEERADLLQAHQITELFSRNLILAVLTGIIGDSQMGKFLKTKHEQRTYRVFSNMFNQLLVQETVKASNFSDQQQVFSELQRLSASEENCYRFLLSRRQRSRSIAYVALSEDDLGCSDNDCDAEIIVTVSRAVVDELAEESGRLGLVAYYDDPRKSDFIQFRLRRSRRFRTFDLRRVLELLAIHNGGGHEGAIGFRVPRSEVSRLDTYIYGVIESLEKALKAAGSAP